MRTFPNLTLFLIIHLVVFQDFCLVCGEPYIADQKIGSNAIHEEDGQRVLHRLLRYNRDTTRVRQNPIFFPFALFDNKHILQFNIDLSLLNFADILLYGLSR